MSLSTVDGWTLRQDMLDAAGLGITTFFCSVLAIFILNYLVVGLLVGAMIDHWDEMHKTEEANQRFIDEGLLRLKMETLRESKEQKMSEHVLDPSSNAGGHSMLSNERPPRTLREAINQRVGRPGADLAPVCHRFAEISWFRAYMESLDVSAHMHVTQ